MHVSDGGTCTSSVAFEQCRQAFEASFEVQRFGIIITHLRLTPMPPNMLKSSLWRSWRNRAACTIKDFSNNALISDRHSQDDKGSPTSMSLVVAALTPRISQIFVEAMPVAEAPSQVLDICQVDGFTQGCLSLRADKHMHNMEMHASYANYMYTCTYTHTYTDRNARLSSP